MYIKATEPDSVDAFLTTETTLSNLDVMAQNYDAIGASEAASLRHAEGTLDALLKETPGAT